MFVVLQTYHDFEMLTEEQVYEALSLELHLFSNIEM